MNLIADESVDSGIISRLRQLGIAVVSISEISAGIKDSEVLKISADDQILAPPPAIGEFFKSSPCGEDLGGASFSSYLFSCHN